jgi:O-acetyl-ADP-ribose deacetylase (regulator of RNase III)
MTAIMATGPCTGLNMCITADTVATFVNLFGIQLAHELALATATDQPFDATAAARSKAEAFTAISGDVGPAAVDRITAAAMDAMSAHKPPETTCQVYISPEEFAAGYVGQRPYSSRQLVRDSRHAYRGHQATT